MKKVKESNVDAYIVRNDANRNYLCSKGNYYLPGILLITAEEVFLATPSRNIKYFKNIYSEYTVFFGGIDEIVKTSFSKGIKSLGYESTTTSKYDYDMLVKKFSGVELVDMPQFIEDVRMIKTEKEVEFIQQAVDLADKAYLEFLNFIKVGMTEKQARNIFNDILMHMGAEGFSFDTLLSSGSRCFMPHCAPTEKVIKKGDLVLMDFGVVLNGYCSDTSRTIVMGNADDRQKEMYNLVLKAQIMALENIKAGMTCREADAFSRNIITKKLDKGCFDYGLGHGIGMEVHEKPRLHPQSDYILSENTIVSVEPGIYIENWGGIRIEDLLLIEKEKGGRNLTKAPKDTLLEI